MATFKKAFFQGLWKLAKDYWQSEEKWKAYGLLIVVALLNFFGVYILILINEWYNSFYNALQEYNQVAFWDLVAKFLLLALIYIFSAVYALYLRQMLEINWRNWMTKHYLSRWLQVQTYYKMQVVSDNTDNPDQRISEDIKLFTNLTLQLLMGFLKQLAILVAFVVVLWRLSGEFNVVIAGQNVTIYGYMVWLSLIYAVIGTWLTAKIGKPLIQLNYNQQRYEADFRFDMVRLRENSESIAFYGGEEIENNIFKAKFAHIFNNFRALMRYQKRLTWFTNGYGQLAVIFPLLLGAPRYFSGKIQLGGLMQIASAFGRVQDALSFFVDSYATLAEWVAVVKRITDFSDNMEQTLQLQSKISFENNKNDNLLIDKMEVQLPQGNVLIKDLNLNIKQGDKLLITGASGCGKSTFLRTLAGLWPFGTGLVQLREGDKKIFLPQKPYLPLGSLQSALAYPQAELDLTVKEFEEVLIKCSLSHLSAKLTESDDWSRILSLGEQQRIAFARTLLYKPQWIFLDEATSALDEQTEETMYELLAKELPDSAVISIGHRNTLRKYHQYNLQIDNTGQWILEKI